MAQVSCILLSYLIDNAFLVTSDWVLLTVQYTVAYENPLPKQDIQSNHLSGEHENMVHIPK